VKTLAAQDDTLAARITSVENDLGDNPPYAPLASPALTGNPTAPTPPSADNDTSIATTAYVKSQGFAPLASPALTGVPTAPTPSSTVATTQLATTAFVRQGTPTDDNAAAGQVGEYLAAQTLSTAAIPITSGVDTGVSTLALTPGDWDVWGSVGFTMSANNSTVARAWLNPTGAATAPAVDQVGGHAIMPIANNTAQSIMPITPLRVSVGTNTTIRLGTTVTTSGGTISAWGKIMARRAR